MLVWWGAQLGMKEGLGCSGCQRLGQGADPRIGQWECVRKGCSVQSQVGSGSKVEALQGICGLWLQVLGAGVV